MSVSSFTVKGKTKIKIVLLGDQNVGKTSIIERYINNKFDDSQTVHIFWGSLQSELTLLSPTSKEIIKTIGYNFGIQQDSKGLKVWFQVT